MENWSFNSLFTNGSTKVAEPAHPPILVLPSEVSWLG